MSKRISITKIGSMILSLVIIIGCFSTITASAALGTQYKFVQYKNVLDYMVSGFKPFSVTENINGGNFNGTRTICFGSPSARGSSVTVTVKDKKGKVKTYANLTNGGKFGVPAGMNTVTFKCNLDKKLSTKYYTYNQLEAFEIYAYWYWK